MRAAVAVALLLDAAMMGARAERYPVRLFTSADGLPVDSTVDAVLDRDGYLWSSSGGYLIRFDGVEFELFGSDRGLAARPQALAQSAEGVLWIGTGSGLQYLAPDGRGRVESLPADAPLASEEIRSICVVSPSEIAVASGQQVWKVTGSPPRLAARPVYRVPTELGLSSIDCDRTGTIWVSTGDRTLGRISADDVATSLTLNIDAAAAAARGTALDRFGHLWVSTWNGVCVGDASAPAGVPFCRRFIREASGHFVGFGTGVAVMEDGSILLAGANGLLRFDPQRDFDAPLAATSIRKEQGLDGGELAAVLEDRFGNAWATDKRSGLWRVALREVRSFGAPELQHPLFTEALLRLRDGTMLVAGKRLDSAPDPRMVQWWNGSTWAESAYPREPGQPRIGWGYNQVVAQQADGTVWFATFDGIRGYAARTIAKGGLPRRSEFFASPAQEQSKDEVWRLWADRGGLLWLTRGGRCYRFDPAANRLSRLTLGLPDPSWFQTAHAFVEDDRGLVWIAYNYGVGRPLAGDRWEYLTIGDPTDPAASEDLVFDVGGALWVATSRGLYRTPEPRAAKPPFTRVWPAPGAMPRRVGAVCLGVGGEIYAGADVGVLVFDRGARLVEHYSAGSGLPSLLVNALERDPEGRMWAGTARGVAILPTLDRGRPPVPDPLLVRLATPLRQVPLALNGQAVVTGLVLQPDERALEIAVRSVVMEADRRVAYRTLLEEVDRDWSPPTAQRQLRIAGLSAGRYTLRIRSEDQAGWTGEHEARVEFEVRAPFYERPWFAAVVLGALALAALAWQRQRAQRALAIERTRTTIATDLHDEIGAGLSRIAVLGEAWARERHGPDRPEPAAETTPAHVAEIARRLVDRMSDLVWAINPERDRVFSLAQRMRQFATPLLRSRGIAFQLRSIDEEHDRALDGATRREFLLIFQEAINNAVKHSGCLKVTVELTLQAGDLVLAVEDDGCGFDAGARVEGTGLSSIRGRAERLGGSCEVASSPGSGSRVCVRAPLRRRR